MTLRRILQVKQFPGWSLNLFLCTSPQNKTAASGGPYLPRAPRQVLEDTLIWTVPEALGRCDSVYCPLIGSHCVLELSGTVTLPESSSDWAVRCHWCRFGCVLHRLDHFSDPVSVEVRESSTSLSFGFKECLSFHCRFFFEFPAKCLTPGKLKLSLTGKPVRVCVWVCSLVLPVALLGQRLNVGIIALLVHLIQYPHRACFSRIKHIYSLLVPSSCSLSLVNYLAEITASGTGGGLKTPRILLTHTLKHSHRLSKAPQKHCQMHLAANKDAVAAAVGRKAERSHPDAWLWMRGEEAQSRVSSWEHLNSLNGVLYAFPFLVQCQREDKNEEIKSLKAALQWSGALIAFNWLFPLRKSIFLIPKQTK